MNDHDINSSAFTASVAPSEGTDQDLLAWATTNLSALAAWRTSRANVFTENYLKIACQDEENKLLTAKLVFEQKISAGNVMPLKTIPPANSPKKKPGL